MSKLHNKKRNVGLLYEFLIATISNALIEGDKNRSEIALDILKTHFRKGTELYKEFRLVNSLVKTNVSSSNIAYSILSEVKSVLRTRNSKKLDDEKSILIAKINKQLGQNVFESHVNDYKIYATIHSLFSEWSSTNKDLHLIAEYEQKLLNWLTEQKLIVESKPINQDSDGMSKLISKIMVQKLNEKYDSSLSLRQKSILKEYVFSIENESNVSNLRNMLSELKSDIINLIDKNIHGFSTSQFIYEKLISAREKILNENLNVEINDDTISRFMVYVKLNDEFDSLNKVGEN